MCKGASRKLLSLFFLCSSAIHMVGGDVRHGTGYREHEERASTRFTDDGEPDPTAKVDKVRCGEVSNLAYEESIKFKLNKHECTLTMLGSMAEQCTAAITCSTLDFPEPEHGKCKKGHITITDSLGGILTMCGKQKFRGPYIPSKSGSDLTITYKNPLSKHTVCQVVCNEDRERRVQIPSRPLINTFSRRKDKGCLCGVNHDKKPYSRGRVIGGMAADPNDYPWLAAIVDKGTRKHFCGGSLINDRYILTAAHCLASGHKVKVKDVDILLHAHVMDFNPNADYDPNAPAGARGSVQEVPGLNLPPKSDKDERSIRVAAEKFIVHPLYRSRSTDFDVALIKLAKRIDLNHPDITTICLAQEGHVRGYADHTAKVAGWGKPHEKAGAASRLLQKLSVPIVHYKVCSDALEEKMTPRMLCAGELKGGRDSCVGDSGGPLIYQFNEMQYRQIGVVSFGRGCARKNSPGVYTNVQEVLQWIYYETRDAAWCMKEDKDTM